MIVTSDSAPAILSNPFATRFVRPGSLHYRFRTEPTCDGDQGSHSDRAMLLDIVQRLNQHRVGLLVGPHGSGKTTLLCSLLPALNQSFVDVAHVQLCSPGIAGTADPQQRIDRRRSSKWKAGRHAMRLGHDVRRVQSRLRSGGLLVIDGAEQLNMFDLTRLRRAAQRVGHWILATSHQPLRGMAVLHQTQVSRGLVESLAQELLAGAPEPWQHLVAKELQRQDWNSLSDVRQLWFELYDLIHPQLRPMLLCPAEREC